MTWMAIAQMVDETPRSSPATLTLLLSSGAFVVWIAAFGMALRRAKNRLSNEC